MSEEKKDVVSDEDAEKALFEKLCKKYGVPSAGVVNVTVPNTEVKLVYLSESLGHIETSNVSLDVSRYGETFSLPRSSMDEVVGKYHSWFDKGILAIADANADYAADKNLRVASEFHLTALKLDKLGTMTPEEITKLWKDPSLTSAQRGAIVRSYKQHFINGDKGYQDIGRVSVLNTLTDGGFKVEVAQLGGTQYKYEPTDMSTGKRGVDMDFFEQKVVDADYRSDK